MTARKNIAKRLYRMFPKRIKRLVVPNKGNVNPSVDFVNCVKLVKSKTNGPIRIAEIGVDKGASSTVVIKLLDASDTLDLFDRESCEFFQNLKNVESNGKINIYACSDKEYDSYFWELAKVYEQIPDSAIYDVVYLDGSHTYPVDGATVPLLMKMLKRGGILILDDTDWTMAASPTCNTQENKTKFTRDQMISPHVALLERLFLRDNQDFSKMKNSDQNHKRSIYEKV